MGKKKKLGKKIACAVTAAAVTGAMSLPPFAVMAFEDTVAHWAEEYIQSLSEKGYLGGYEDGTFRPEQHLTRAEFAKIIAESKELKNETDVTFTDMADGAWYTSFIRKMVAAGYMSGYEDGTIRPDDAVSRQESAVILARAFDREGDGSMQGFTDADLVADWARAGVSGLIEAGVLNGYEDGTIRPAENVTRAETAKMLDKLLSMEEENQGGSGGGIIGGGGNNNGSGNGSGGTGGSGSGGSGGSSQSTVTFSLAESDLQLALQPDQARTIEIESLHSGAKVTATSSDEAVVTAEGYDGEGEQRLKVTAHQAGEATVKFIASASGRRSKTIEVSVTVTDNTRAVSGSIAGLTEGDLVHLTAQDTTTQENFYTTAIAHAPEGSTRSGDATAVYTLHLPDGNYSVTASTLGYTFSPANVVVGEEPAEVTGITAAPKAISEIAADPLLQAALDKAEALLTQAAEIAEPTEEVTQSVQAVTEAKTALSDAKDVLAGEENDENAAVVLAAQKTLNLAMVGLEKAALQMELNRFDGLDFTAYTIMSWDRYETVYRKAVKVYQDANAASETVQDITAKLKEAYAGLAENPVIPTPEPTEEPGESPSPEPSGEPEGSPSPSPSAEPGESPSPSPTEEPGESPSPEPSAEPGESPSPSPTEEPGESPSPEPSGEPEESPSPSPSTEPGESPEPDAEQEALNKVLNASGKPEGANDQALSLTLLDIQNTGITGADEKYLDSYRYTLQHANTEGYVTLTDKGSLQSLITAVNENSASFWSALQVDTANSSKAQQYVQIADEKVTITLPKWEAGNYFVNAANNRIYLDSTSRDNGAPNDSFVYKYLNTGGDFEYVPNHEDGASTPVNRAAVMLKAGEKYVAVWCLKSENVKDVSSQGEIAFEDEASGQFSNWSVEEGEGKRSLQYGQLEFAVPYTVGVTSDEG